MAILTGSVRRIIKRVPGSQMLVHLQRRRRARAEMRERGMSLRKFAIMTLRTGSTAFDIGANVGETAVELRDAVGPAGNVYAFEPNPSSYRLMESRFTASGKTGLHAVPLALSDQAGSLTLFVDDRAGACASTFVKGHASRESAWHGATYTETLVRTALLDDFCASLNVMPQFLKIDVEGAEDAVIRGGVRLVQEFRPTIWFECWAGIEEGKQFNENLGHFSLLADAGYVFAIGSIFNVAHRWIDKDDRANPRQILPLDPGDLSSFPTIGCDVIAAPASEMRRLLRQGLISRSTAADHISRVSKGTA